MNWIDLSLPVDQHMPVYPGDPPVEFHRFLTYEEDGYQASALSMSCHAGTHVDAPRHFDPGGLTVDQIPLDRLMGTARVVRLEIQADYTIDIPESDLTTWCPGDGLLLATGWDKRARSSDFYKQIPLFQKGTSQKLLRMNVRFLGLDLPTVVEQTDPPCLETMHRLLLGSGLPIVESLRGLLHIAGRRVFFQALPLVLSGCEASPVRACCRLLDDE
jgi:arylformamidase